MGGHLKCQIVKTKYTPKKTYTYFRYWFSVICNGIGIAPRLFVCEKSCKIVSGVSPHDTNFKMAKLLLKLQVLNGNLIIVSYRVITLDKNGTIG